MEVLRESSGLRVCRTLVAVFLTCWLAVVAAHPAGAAVAARAAAAADGSFEPPWKWPLDPQPTVLRHFEPPPEPWAAGHRGVDLAAPSTAGLPPEVRSPAAGRVLFVGFVVDRPVVTVGHGDGLVSSFEPVDAGVQPGDMVATGSVLGTVSRSTASRGTHVGTGKTAGAAGDLTSQKSAGNAADVTAGRTTGHTAHCPVQCVHWGVRLNGDYVNPLNYVSDRRPSVLLPFD